MGKTSIVINRGVIHQSDLYPKYQNEEFQKTSKVHFWKNVKKRFQCTPFKWILDFVPILKWLPKYKWKSDFTFDLIAGFTCAVFNIPQGMAYIMLANLPPIIGIYMGFFQVIAYAIFGTCKHLAVGTFAVVTLMSGKVIAKGVEAFEAERQNGVNSTVSSEDHAIKIACALSLSVGIWQFGMGILRLGSLSVLLFTEVVSGFTTGAAIHVVVSQIKGLLGLKIPQIMGVFNIIKTLILIFSKIHMSNWMAMIFSSTTFICLGFYNEILKPRIAKKIKFPLPMELITIIIGTVVVRHWKMNESYGLSIVGKIPTGLPPPKVPEASLLGQIFFVDGLIVCIVAYALSISVAKLFAQKHGYKIDVNQELIAHAASNVVGAFFKCAPSCASLVRCVIIESVGVSSQLAGLICAGILLVVLLWIAPFFEAVPNCVLAAMIIIALKGMLLQVKDFPKSWRESRINGAIWICTFLATVILDIEYGLCVGVGLALLTLLWGSNKPYVKVLGSYGHDTGIFLDIKNEDERICEFPDIKILKFTGNLNFVTIESFMDKVRDFSPISKPMEDKLKEESDEILSVSSSGKSKIQKDDKWIILDLSCVSSIDPVAARGLLNLVKEYKRSGFDFFFTGFSSNLMDTLWVCGVLKELDISNFFPTISDAIAYSKIEK